MGAKDKYILLLKDQKKSSVSSVSSELEVFVTSSEELSDENKSYDNIDKDRGVLYKNLDILVVQAVEEKQLQEAVNDPKSPILYFEKEREFYPADEKKLIKELKSQTTVLQKKITELEKYLLTQQTKPVEEIKKTLTKLEWGLKAIGIDQTNLTGKGIDICILDTGFDVSHPDFKNREIEGKSFVEAEDWNVDTHGHGTHCAGVAAGNVRTDSGKRYGVAKDCNLKIAKVLSKTGKGTTSSIIDAIDWAITKKFRVISMSLASPVDLNETPSPLFEEVGKRALENNCLIIAAAGNDSSRPSLPRPVSAPANCNSIMAVAAVDSYMKIAKFSNGGLNASTGGNIDLAAPGVGIISSYSKKGSDGFYKSMNGTSMATPHVSGLTALYMEKFPNLTAKEIWDSLEENAKAIEGTKYRDVGSGLVQIPK